MCSSKNEVTGEKEKTLLPPVPSLASSVPVRVGVQSFLTRTPVKPG